MTLDDLLSRLEVLLEDVDGWQPDVRERVHELLDGIDALHRLALTRLGALLDEPTLTHLQNGDPAVAWLLDVYGVAVDERAAVQTALDELEPYVDSHGGRIEVLDVRDGVVSLRLAGSCAGCSGSEVTLTHGVEEALRKHLPGFRRLEVAEDDAPAHPPPGATLLELHPGKR